MSNYENIGELLDNNPKLKHMCEQEHFVMRQHSDALESNKFDHLSFVGSEPIKTALRREQPLVCVPNSHVKETYSQLFMENSIYNKHKKYIDKLDSKNLYTFVDSYREMFSGLISVDKYLVLVNSTIFTDNYPVFILIDGESQDIRIGPKNKKIEFYGLICIGFLIDIGPYTEEMITDFESNAGFTVPSQIRNYLLKNSTIIYEKKLFKLDLESIDDSLKTKFTTPSKNINNFKLIKRITEATDDEKAALIEGNNNFVQK